MASGTTKDGHPPRRMRVRSGDVLLVIILGAVFLIAVNISFKDLIGLLYHPVAGLLLFVIIIEFLWLKSGDRTRVYRLEIDRLRTQKRRDEDLLNKSRELIEQVMEAEEDEKKVRPGDWRGRAVDTCKEIKDRL